MKPPIVINDSPRVDMAGDVRVYDSVASAERSLEVPDAADTQLHAFDADGQVLKIVSRANAARLESGQPILSDKGLLTRLLKDHLLRVGAPAVSVEKMALEALIDLAFKKSPNPYS